MPLACDESNDSPPVSDDASMSDGAADAKATATLGDATSGSDVAGEDGGASLLDGGSEAGAAAPRDAALDADATIDSGAEGADAAANEVDTDAANQADADAANTADADAANQADADAANQDGADEDASDADGGGIDASTVTTESILDALGAGCLDCVQRAGCLQPDAGYAFPCEDFGSATAAAGPSAGALKRDLCLSALQCIASSACILPDYDSTSCYCGTGGCQGTAPPDGPCLAQEQDGLESTNTAVNILGTSDGGAPTQTNTTLASGLANVIATCAATSCDFVCWPMP
jgi:hypothetical protein